MGSFLLWIGLLGGIFYWPMFLLAACGAMIMLFDSLARDDDDSEI